MRALLMTVALAACATPAEQTRAPEVPMAETHALDGTAWRRADDAESMPHPATIQFDSQGGAAGFTGCNRWFAQAERHEDGALRFGAAGTTRMACAAPAMAAEQRFLDVLSRTASARIEDNTLVFLDAGGEVIAHFERAD
ncbi:MAG: META domain-containing protein [Hyphomonadaceae bacterium]